MLLGLSRIKILEKLFLANEVCANPFFILKVYSSCILSLICYGKVRNFNILNESTIKSNIFCERVIFVAALSMSKTIRLIFK
jgi:hypothetical protein